jgi:bifunctional DNA-binding transcriptional regulator/antitoxin component of YhaV-PrlF toxin-antitoxin module
MTVAIKNNNNTPLVVPRAIRRKAGFKSGQELEIKAAGGVITIVPKVPAAAGEYTAAERRTIDRGIAQSEKEYGEGKHAGPFGTAEEFLADLHRESAKLDKKRTYARK